MLDQAVLETGSTTRSASPDQPTQSLISHHKVLPGIQYLRGLAAILVVMRHANGIMQHDRYYGKIKFALIETGLFGVAIFFVISGFIITIVSLDRSLLSRVDRGTFLLKRAARILPFMWVCVIGYNAISFIGTKRIDWWPAFTAMTLWPAGELKPNVLWSLRHEFLFYALFAWQVLSPKPRWWLLALWALTPLSTSLWPYPLESLSPALAQLVWIVFEGSGTGANLQFGAGILIAVLWLKRGAIGEVSGGVGLAATIAATGLATIAVEWIALPPGPLRTLFWTVLAAGVVLASLPVAFSQSSIGRFFMLIGNASFSIYLVHSAVVNISLEVSAKLFGFVHAGPFWLATVMLSVLVGIALHLLVEVPLIDAAWRMAQPRREAALAPQ